LQGKKYYQQNECVVGEKPVPFVLIPSEEKGKQPFYIMVDRVWNGLFAEFVAGHEDDPAVQKSQWKKGAVKRNADGDSYIDLGSDDPMMPVFRADIQEAELCAEWLGGQLPTAAQWDRAAGLPTTLKEEDSDKGPFEPDWQPGDIAVGREEQGPMAVGKAAKDRSIYGVHDMAGNGFEWTRSCKDASLDYYEYDGNLSKVGPTWDVLLRGRTYFNPDPLTFGQFSDRFMKIPFFETERTLDATRIESYKNLLPQTGFRVVVEPQS